ncbi:MAG TPA: type II toxin-antitoxin system VapC family toxin [Verrucomicrobiae bacterium]|jgi:predicted nucleic acid-binding protein|nr:type II toxin-antitoxin system VapC family toxin [Verrucomicrobiae bacterium]
MTVVYIDSSVIVSIALGDPRGAQALAIVGSRDAYTSELAPVECQAALSSQYASAAGGLTAAEQALNAVLGRLQMIQVTGAILSQARTLVRRHRSGIGLRTLDAFHVATCAEVQAQLGMGTMEYVTADRRQHNAFTAEGFAGVFLP